MRYYLTAGILTILSFSALSQSNFSNGRDYAIEKKNLVVEQNLYVLKNFELTGTLKGSGISYFGNKVSIGSFSEPSETLDVFGNLKTRGTIFAEHLNVQNSVEIGQDLSVGRDLVVTRYGYFEKVGIGVTGPLTESLEVNGNIKATGNLLSKGLQTEGNGHISQNLNVGGQVSVTGDASFSSNAIFDGQVGIGVSPTEKLDVQGNIRSSDGLISQTVSTTDITAATATISNTLQVEGVSTFGDEVSIEGATSMSDNLDVDGDAYVSGNVGIGVATPTEKLEVTGNAKLSGTLYSASVETPSVRTDEISSAGELVITSPTSLQNNLSVGGNAEVTGDVSIEGPAVLQSTLGIGVANPIEKLEVEGNAKVSGSVSANSINSESFTTNTLEVTSTLTVGGTTTLSDVLNVSGATQVGNTLEVTGATTLNDALTVAGNTSLASDLSVGGNNVVTGNLGIGVAAPTEKLDVAGNAKVSQTLTANAINSKEFSSDNLAVTNTLNVGGTTTLNDALNVSGATQLNSSLAVTGATTLNDALSVTGKTALASDLSVGGNNVVTGNLGIGVATPSEKLEVAGSAKVDQNVGIGNNATVGNQLVVNGKIGVGMTPEVALDVNGDIRLSGQLETSSLTSESMTLDYAIVNQNLEVSGQSTLKDLSVSGASHMQNGMSVTGLTYVNGQVGIGKEIPAESLDVVGNVAISGNLAASVVSSSTINVTQDMALSGLAASEVYESFLVVDATGKVHTRSLRSFQPVTQSETNVAIQEQTLSIGTDAVPQGYQVAVDGKIISNELTIQQTADWSWPDYVFSEDYELKSLEETETYIKEHKHLPEVPSALEIKNEGVQVGEMNAILLKKIEELTLYVIELKKENDAIKAELKTLK